MKLGIKIQQYKTRSGGLTNNFIIKTDNGTFLQSYQSIIAFIPNDSFNNKVILDINTWNYSRNTSCFRSNMLKESSGETKKRIKKGNYILDNLNE